MRLLSLWTFLCLLISCTFALPIAQTTDGLSLQTRNIPRSRVDDSGQHEACRHNPQSCGMRRENRRWKFPISYAAFDDAVKVWGTKWTGRLGRVGEGADDLWRNLTWGNIVNLIKDVRSKAWRVAKDVKTTLGKTGQDVKTKFTGTKVWDSDRSWMNEPEIYNPKSPKWQEANW